MAITNIERNIRFSNLTREEYETVADKYRHQLLPILMESNNFKVTVTGKDGKAMSKKEIIDAATKLSKSDEENTRNLGNSILQFMKGTIRTLDVMLIAISSVVLMGGVVLSVCIDVIIGFLLYVVTILPAQVVITALVAQYKSLGGTIETSKDKNVIKYKRLVKNIISQKDGVKDIQEVASVLRISEAMDEVIECDMVTPNEDPNVHEFCSIIRACDDRIRATGDDDVHAFQLQIAGNLSPEDQCYHIENCEEASDPLFGLKAYAVGKDFEKTARNAYNYADEKYKKKHGKSISEGCDAPDRKSIYDTSIQMFKKELRQRDKHLGLFNSLSSTAQWGACAGDEMDNFLNGSRNDVTIYRCNTNDVFPGGSYSTGDPDMGYDTVRDGNINSSFWNQLNGAIENINGELPSGFKLNMNSDTDDCCIYLQCSGGVSESYSILESVNIGNDDGTEMFMTLENVIKEPLLDGTGLLHGVISIVTDACDRTTTLKFLQCYKNTAKYEFTHPNYSDIPLLYASNAVLEYAKERCEGSPELMGTVNMLDQAMGELVDDAYDEATQEAEVGGAPVTCANPSTTETGFNPDPFSIGSLTPFPVASRKVGYSLYEIDRAETDDEITEAMLNFGRVASIIEEHYIVQGSDAEGYLILESEAGKVARAASDKASGAFSKAATKDKTAGVKAAVKRTIDPMEKFIQQQYDTLKEKDANERRNIILKGGAAPKVMRWIKRGIGILIGSAVGQVIPAASIVTGIVFIGYIATDKYLDRRERAKLLKELEDEIMICNEKIDDSRGDDNKQNKYELMRIRNQLNRTSEKIRLGLKY